MQLDLMRDAWIFIFQEKKKQHLAQEVTIYIKIMF